MLAAVCSNTKPGPISKGFEADEQALDERRPRSGVGRKGIGEIGQHESEGRELQRKCHSTRVECWVDDAARLRLSHHRDPVFGDLALSVTQCVVQCWIPVCRRKGSHSEPT